MAAAGCRPFAEKKRFAAERRIWRGGAGSPFDPDNFTPRSVCVDVASGSG
jgi:hypothetical protein